MAGPDGGRPQGQNWEIGPGLVIQQKKKSPQIQTQDVQDGGKAEVRAKGAGVSQPGEGTEAVPGDWKEGLDSLLGNLGFGKDTFHSCRKEGQGKGKAGPSQQSEVRGPISEVPKFSRG